MTERTAQVDSKATRLCLQRGNHRAPKPPLSGNPLQAGPQRALTASSAASRRPNTAKSYAEVNSRRYQDRLAVESFPKDSREMSPFSLLPRHAAVTHGYRSRGARRASGKEIQRAAQSPDTRPHPREEEEAFDNLSSDSDSFNSSKECTSVTEKPKKTPAINN